MRVLNLNLKQVTVYKGTKVELVEDHFSCCDWSSQEQSVVEKLMENMPPIWNTISLNKLVYY